MGNDWYVGTGLALLKCALRMHYYVIRGSVDVSLLRCSVEGGNTEVEAGLELASHVCEQRWRHRMYRPVGKVF